VQTLNQHTTHALTIISVSTETKIDRPFIDQGISAGFPSPAQDFIDLSIDLNKELIKHPSSTFFGRVKGSSMIDAGINNGDLLIVDKSLNPTDGKIAVCFIDGEFTVKRLKVEKDCCWLLPENGSYDPIKVTAENDFIVWGIVVYVIKAL
jgi:DNA polymerase V